MLVAEAGGERRHPLRTGERGSCPGCGGEVLSRCGEHVIWHWAHRRRVECDAWSEPEGDWHRKWKQMLAGSDTSRMEVTLRDEGAGVWHRADVMTLDGWVVELQHSPISPEDIRAREAFYREKAGGMVWLFNYTSRPWTGDQRDHRLDDARCLRLVHTAGGYG